MEVRFLIPRVLRAYANEDLMIRIRGNTIADLLHEIEREHPELYRCICDETGALRKHINLFVGDELVVRNLLRSRLHPGDVVSVFQAVSGG